MYDPDGSRHSGLGHRPAADNQSVQSSLLSGLTDHMVSLASFLSSLWKGPRASTVSQSTQSVVPTIASETPSRATEPQYKTDDSALPQDGSLPQHTVMTIQVEWVDTREPDPKSRGAVFVNGMADDASPFFTYFWRTETTDPSDYQERLNEVKEDLIYKVNETVQRPDVCEEILSVIKALNFRRDPREQREKFEFRPERSVRVWADDKWRTAYADPIKGQLFFGVR
jgi:hypothetical protein